MFALHLKEEEHAAGNHCCAEMSKQASLRGGGDKRVYWSPIFSEYGLVSTAVPEMLLISFCPFCGAALPKSRRDEWFKRLEKTGWATWGDPIPEHLLRATWAEL